MIGLRTMSRFTRSVLLTIGAIMFMLCPTMTLAQGASVWGQALTSTGKPAAYATVRVCAYTGGGIPCTPLSSLYSDLALTQPISNPYTTDSFGNFTIFVASGNAYLVQLNVGSGVTYAYQVTAGGVGGGTVSSVGLTVPSGLLNVTGSPITGAGTFAVTLANQSANTAFLGPASGSAAAPTFRTFNAADITPAGTLTNSTTGNAATATALATTPGNCSAGSAPTGISASGAAQNCTPYLQAGSVVTKIINGTGIAVSPSGGTGNVTVSETLPFTSLTTTGTSGAATIPGGALNIPIYCPSGGCAPATGSTSYVQTLPSAGTSQSIAQGDGSTFNINQDDTSGTHASFGVGDESGIPVVSLAVQGTPSSATLTSSTATPGDIETIVTSGSGANSSALTSQTPSGTTLAATNTSLSVNQNSPAFGLGGAYYTGSTNLFTGWFWQDMVGAGASPTEVLTLSHTGNASGTQKVSMPFEVDLGDGSTVNASAICTTATGCSASGAVQITSTTNQYIAQNVSGTTPSYVGANLIGGGNNPFAPYTTTATVQRPIYNVPTGVSSTYHYWAVSNSLTRGLGASNAAHSYPGLLNNYLGSPTFANIAVDGSNACYATDQEVFQYINPSTAYSGTLVTVADGTNDASVNYGPPPASFFACNLANILWPTFNKENRFDVGAGTIPSGWTVDNTYPVVSGLTTTTNGNSFPFSFTATGGSQNVVVFYRTIAGNGGVGECDVTTYPSGAQASQVIFSNTQATFSNLGTPQRAVAPAILQLAGGPGVYSGTCSARSATGAGNIVSILSMALIPPVSATSPPSTQNVVIAQGVPSAGSPQPNISAWDGLDIANEWAQENAYYAWTLGANVYWFQPRNYWFTDPAHSNGDYLHGNDAGYAQWAAGLENVIIPPPKPYWSFTLNSQLMRLNGSYTIDSSVGVGGGFITSSTTLSCAYGANDMFPMFGTGITITLPSAASCTPNKTITLNNIGDQFSLPAIAISAGSYLNINSLPPGYSITFIDQSSNWFVKSYGPTTGVHITGTTSSIGGSPLSAGTCATGTATISGGTAGHPVSVSTSDGSDIGGDFFYRGVVTNSTTVTVSVCAAVLGTPTANTYNISTY